MDPARTAATATFPLPPRESAWRNGTSAAGLWLLRLVVLPHTLAGVAILGVMLGSLLWLAAGMNYDAQVTDTWTTRSKGRPVCHVSFTYLHGGDRYAGDGTVNCAHRDALARPGAEVPVRALHLGRRLHHAALASPFGSPYVGVALLWVFGLLWVGGVGAFSWTLYGLPARQRRLVETGKAIDGTLTRKHVRRGKSTSHYIDYTYQPVGGPQRTASQRVGDRARWDAATEGAPIVVLYAPDDPTQSLAYDYGPYVVRPRGF